MKSCDAFVQHAVKSRRVSTSMLSPEVINKFAKDGYRLLQQMLNRHAAYKSLPCPLRGKDLHSKASTVGLVQRTMTVRVNASTLREECNQAKGRRRMKMPEEIGRQCKNAVIVKTKRKKMRAGHQSASDRDWSSGHYTRTKRLSLVHLRHGRSELGGNRSSCKTQARLCT
jgi:hypothetical protein